MASIVASDLERIVIYWLDRNNINYDFQTSFGGGHYQLGGSVVDFIIPDRMLAWRVQGEYWHSGVEKTGSDITQKEILASAGYTVVDLQADDLLNRTEQTLRLALQGEEML